MSEKPESGDWTPRPDPTVLTSQALVREIASLREILTSELTGLQQTHAARLDAMDEAIRLHRQSFDRIPIQIDDKVANLRALHEEKFAGVQKQFDERDSRIEQTARDSKLAIDAALQAAEKAVGKSELSTLKQIDGQAELIRATSKNSDDKIDDLKQRVTRIESIAVGRVEVTGDVSKSNSWTLSLIMGAVGIAGLVVTLIVVLSKGGG